MKGQLLSYKRQLLDPYKTRHDYVTYHLEVIAHRFWGLLKEKRTYRYDIYLHECEDYYTDKWDIIIKSKELMKL